MSEKRKEGNMSENTGLDLPEGQGFTGMGAAPQEAAPQGAQGKQAPQEAAPQENRNSPAPQGAQEKQAPQEEKPAEADPDNEPIKDWDKASLGLENLEINREVFAEFGKQAVALGLSPRQARGLAEWQLSQIGQARAKMVEEGIKELNREWGKSAGDNQNRIVALIQRVDQALGNNSFSEMLFDSDAACSTAFMRGMLALADMAREDAVGGQPQAIGKKEETALEGLQEVFRMARGK